MKDILLTKFERTLHELSNKKYISWGNQALLNCPCFSSATIWNFISLKFKHVFKWQWCSNSHESKNCTVGYCRRMEQGTFHFGLPMTPSTNGGPLIWKYASELLTYLLTYLLAAWYRVPLDQLTGLQLVKKFPAFHGIRRFITALTSVRHLSLSWASLIRWILF